MTYVVSPKISVHLVITSESIFLSKTIPTLTAIQFLVKCYNGQVLDSSVPTLLYILMTFFLVKIILSLFFDYSTADLMLNTN